MEKRKIKLENLWKHFKTVCTHKRWVFHYCKLCGITWRGIKHDLSKFSPTEFIESVKYYSGTRSPIDACKEENGFSKAWMHHKGRNDHHYEFWQDNIDLPGSHALDMPFHNAVELLCDYLGAGRAYQGKNFTYVGEFKWFINKLNTRDPAMHIHTKTFVYECLEMLASIECTNSELSIKEFLAQHNLFSIYVNTGEFTTEQFLAMRKNVEKGWNKRCQEKS